MDNNFSSQVKEIISYSREEALRLGNDFIGTEHLVLGLIREGENTAVKILKSLNIDLYELRKEIESAVKDKTGFESPCLRPNRSKAVRWKQNTSCFQY